MAETVLIVVAHSDDETIGMAGTIRRHVDEGDRVVVMSMTDGVGSRADSDASDAEHRRAAANEASRILGFEWGECHGFTDNGMDGHPMLDVVKAVEGAKAEYRPNLVYTHSGADLNVDHRVVATAVLTAFRPQPGETCREIRAFEVASATDYGHPTITEAFAPNLFVNIEQYWPAKCEALKAYDAEMREAPHSRSLSGIEAHAQSRGHQVGYAYAEAFQVIRKLIG